ncbi:MAG: uracil-xanthine permease family protein [Clostridia bacterium]|nr:uracil-xanthine permease family protein [Clostridia bacterium]
MSKTTKNILLAIQHVFAMFGATVLVPLLTGLSTSVALFTAGVGTLIFHLVTNRKVPVFLGSSFAFIPVILAVSPMGDNGKPLDPSRLPYALGGIVIAGVMYLLLSLIVTIFGVEKVKSFFPPVVTGPMIMVIGLVLSPTAVDMAQNNWAVALIVLAVVIAVSIFAKGFFKLVPILIGIGVGYLISMVFDITGLSGANPLIFNAHSQEIMAQSKWFGLPQFMFPKFSWEAIALIAPVALVTFMEHIGDITTNGAVVKKDFLTDPGLNRTLLGDGLATVFAGMLGGPANTTYSENTGVLAVTKVYDPKILELAAVFAIAMSLFGKLGGALQTIPTPVMGGVSLILFGMIASIGMRTISEANLDFTCSRNLIIVSLILVMGLSGVILPIGNLKLAGISLAALVGVVLNKLLPENI